MKFVNSVRFFEIIFRMLLKVLNHNWSKFLIALVVVFIVDIAGIFVWFYEWDYTRHFHIFLHDDMSTEQIITSFNYVHNPVEKCNDKELSLVFLIKSAIDHADRRAVIRSTWGNEQRFPHVHLRTVFLLGSSGKEHLQANINMEVAQHKDVVQADFHDTYYNNTLKSLMGMRWAKEHCPNAKFYMFVDDDYYVSTKNLIRFIAHPGCYPSTDGIFGFDELYRDLYAGYVYEAKPFRDKFSKWYIPLSEYPFDKWPPYVTAGAFVLSHDTLRQLFKESLKTRLFRFDDIFLAIAAYKASINITHCGLFHINRPTHSLQYSIASHGFSDPAELLQVWKEYRAAGYA